jgi:23S rRNA (adenine2030-N6)-methyltransferase
MLSYQHGYHAGNFADVVKHFTLTRLLNYMTTKEKPMLYLETHAGRGGYDLKDKQALKTGEARQGIELLWAQRAQLPDVFSPYLDYITQVNKGPTLRYYPGSPALSIHLLRKQDRLSFSELHPGEFEHLQALPRHGKRVFYNNNNGLDQLSALLPPVERRGLIFIDPSFEIKTEYRHIPELMKAAYQRFSTGVYCIWYPLVDKKLHAQLLKGLENIGAENKLRVEFYLTGAAVAGMNGCGLWIINPPYVLQAELKLALDALRKIFNPGVSSYLIEH